MNESTLFSSMQIGNLKLLNRIVICPMAQYSAEDGRMTDWHLIHLGQLACSGAALLTIESTAVTAEGRGTLGDLGLYSDQCEFSMQRVLSGIRGWSDMPIGIQLNHAGRKASRQKAWEGGAQISPSDPTGWSTRGPSPIAWAAGDTPPVALDHDGLAAIRAAFANAARRASRLGLDFIQVHSAHGYLLHEFLSPLSNHRDDDYGGSLQNRMRFPLEVFASVRDAFAPNRPVTVRVSATDWMDGGWSIEDTIIFVEALQARGCSAINVSSGGSSPSAKIPVGPGYQVPLARAVKQSTTLPVVACGLITDFEQAEAIIGTGDADLIGLARTMMYNPHWPWHAAAHFGAQVEAPEQYLRAQPSRSPNLFLSRVAASGPRAAPRIARTTDREATLSEAIAGRRAVRDYTAETVDEQTIRSLIAKAVQAPSAINEQPWAFTVVRDQALLDRASHQAKAHMLSTAPASALPSHVRSMLEDANSHIFHHAPVLVLISAAMPGAFVVEDCTLAAENLMLSAYAAGLGSCWIGSAQGWFKTPEGRAEFDLPDAYEPVAPIVLGHPKAATPPVVRKPPEIRWVDQRVVAS